MDFARVSSWSTNSSDLRSSKKYRGSDDDVSRPLVDDHHSESSSAHAAQQGLNYFARSTSKRIGNLMNPSILFKLSQWIVGTSSKPFDYADCLHFPWTSVIISSFLCMIWIKQYIFKPLQCWVPQEFSRPWEEYAEYYCWVTETYFNSVEKPLEEDIAKRRNYAIGYYQWVPFMLLVQAVAFWMPSVLWTLFAARTSIPLNSLIKSAREAALCDSEQRTRTINYMARCLIDVLLHSAKRGGRSRQMGGQQNQSGGGSKASARPAGSTNGCSSCCKGGIGCFLILAYLLCKIIMIAHALGEVYFIQRFTQTNYTFYGYQLLSDIMGSKQWQQSGVFPRVTWCDFDIRTLGGKQTYSIMCVLPTNMLNEKIYIFLWFWFLFVAVASAFSILVWLKRLLFLRTRRAFIGKFLKYMETFSTGAGGNDKRLWQCFVEGFLRCDGVFVIHILSDKAGDVVTGEVVCTMWEYFKQYGTERRPALRAPKMNGVVHYDNGGDRERFVSFAHNKSENDMA